jgi:two pore calcium channel protein 3
VSNRSACLRRRPPEYVEALWLVLDPDGRGSVSRRDFGDLAELLKMPFTDITPAENVFERFIPTFYESKVLDFFYMGGGKGILSNEPTSTLQFSRNVRALVRHRRFRHVFDVAIVVNAIFIGADVLEGVSEQIFLMLFTAEILLKVKVK